MPRPCETCLHPDREAIDRALVGGEPNRAVARRLGLSKDSVRRHAEEHLPRSLVTIAHAEQADHARSLLEQVRDLQGEALAILRAAKEEGRQTTALAAIREASRLLELAGRVTGELDERPVAVVNIIASEDWQRVRATILRALEPHEAARVAIAGALLKLEAAS